MSYKILSVHENYQRIFWHSIYSTYLCSIN
nr:MAG TPA: hypothetical protein [Caudoviricetes sp.]